MFLRLCNVDFWADVICHRWLWKMSWSSCEGYCKLHVLIFFKVFSSDTLCNLSWGRYDWQTFESREHSKHLIQTTSTILVQDIVKAELWLLSSSYISEGWKFASVLDVRLQPLYTSSQCIQTVHCSTLKSCRGWSLYTLKCGGWWYCRAKIR